jgi:N6-adenosine-specific RNA methylase IME4/ParB-like chromosome segregation protein Spo0J
MHTHPAADLFPVLEGPAFDALAADIQAHGVRVPIVIHPDGSVLDGRNRLRACEAVGVTPAFETWTGELGTETDYVISLNLARRHLDESQRAMVAARLATVVQGARTDLAQICAKSQPEAAARLHVSRRSVQHARVVLAQGTPALIAAVDQGTLAVSESSTLAKLPADAQAAALAQVAAGVKVRQATRAASRSWTPQDWPTGQYGVILADPPWRYEHVETDSRAIENQYPTLSLDTICDYRIPTADDAVLLLWATSPKLAEAMRVIDAWGFTYRTCAVWDKEQIGMGYYFRQQHELLLIAAKGALPVPAPSTRVSSIIRARRGTHSAKPDVVYAIIEQMYPDIPRVELFSRTPRQGWASWGNEETP